jgi:hypothetical protein
MKYIYLSLFAITSIHANNIEVLPSFQGFRGVINTPNSEVMKEGEFEFLYTNQIENISGITSPDFRDNKEQKNFFLNMGFLPNLDLNFQYAYGYDYTKDKKYLSNRVVNAKYQVPFIPKDLFSMAIGIQDMGGGNPYIGNKYAVISKEFNNVRTNIGYAIGDNEGSIDGAFASIEYQPLSWLQIVGEYDSKEWNGAIKSEYSVDISKQKVNFGAMAKSSLDYNDIYFGLYANIPFNDKSLPIKKDFNTTLSKMTLSDLKLSNTDYQIKDDTLYFEYENDLYVYNDIDTLGAVLGVLATTAKVKNIQIKIKKSNIIQYIVEVNKDEYLNFLKSGKYHQNLLQFKNNSSLNDTNLNNSDRFKPTLTLKPDMVIVDGSEYTHVSDHTISLQAELSMRLAKGTIISSRYNIPLSISHNFEDGEVYDYRNRNKTSAEIDQALISQYFQFDLPYRWVSLVQAGLFDKELTGASFESSISTLDGRHTVTVKASKLKDDMYKEMDRYYEEDRNVELISYKYYLDSLNSNLKITAGDFLYGDSGTMFSIEKYFSDTILKFDIADTEHRYKGKNTIGMLTLSIPLGTSKKIKTKYLDIKGDYLTYNKRKVITSNGKIAYAQPHHLKEVDNSFTLEKYYLNNGRFTPAYIKANYNRLRNVFVGE